jgi:hypothetical protein
MVLQERPAPHSANLVGEYDAQPELVANENNAELPGKVYLQLEVTEENGHMDNRQDSEPDGRVSSAQQPASLVDAEHRHSQGCL